MKIYLINGRPRAGKDTFVQYCQHHSVDNYIWNISTVDKVKEAAKILGWNGEKTPEMRRFLSDLKDLAEEHLNSSYNYILDTIARAEQIGRVSAIFVHCREPEQLRKFKEKLNAKCILVYTDREDIEEELTNHADIEVNLFGGYDITINNSGSLEDLERLSLEFLQKEGIV